MLLRIPQVLTKQQVNDIRQIIDNADWADGVITAGSQSAKAKNNTQLPEDGDDCKKGAHHRVACTRHQRPVSHRCFAKTYLSAAL